MKQEIIKPGCLLLRIQNAYKDGGHTIVPGDVCKLIGVSGENYIVEHNGHILRQCGSAKFTLFENPIKTLIKKQLYG